MTSLLETIDIVNEAFASAIIFKDFAKIFNKVSQRALVKKIEAYVFRDDLLKWLTDFLSGRKQRVVLGENVPDWKDVLSVVQEGSVLGPLFIINDMPSVVGSVIKLFSDDTKLLTTIKNCLDVKQLQINIDQLVKWADEWQMDFNGDK